MLCPVMLRSMKALTRGAVEFEENEANDVKTPSF
jgi:hypothetical protein